MKTMVAGFKDVQERYNKCWEKLQAQQQTVELGGQKLNEKVEEAHKLYDEKLQRIKEEDGKLAAARKEATTLRQVI